MLLCDTMDRPQAPDQGLAGDAKHTAIGKHGLQNRQRLLIMRMVVDWHQDETIGDIKIRIAGRRSEERRVGKECRL